MAINPKTFADTSQHSAGIYGHAYGQSDNAAGTVLYAPGIVGMAGNIGLGSVSIAASFVSHPPDILAGGTVANHYAFYDQGCSVGTHATACNGAYFQNSVGVGTATPAYGFDETLGRGIRTTGVLVTTAATASTSPTTGAFLVTGGAGVSGTLWTGAKQVAQVAGAPATYWEGRQDAATLIGTLRRPNGTNDLDIASYGSLQLTPSLTTANSVIKANGPVIQGTTKFTASGCAVSAFTGTSGTAGIMTSGTTGTCTVVITLNGATGMTAPTGWVCSPQNQTTANLLRQTASSATTCTISGTTVTGDVLAFSAVPY
jgi:hypothetical protein